MTYRERLSWFCLWADYYGLQIIKPKYTYDENDTTWAD